MSRSPAKDRYAEAGVDLASAERAKARIAELVKSTRTAASRGAVGAFGGLVRMPEDVKDPVLVASTDGVGTKVLVAIAAGKNDTVGECLVNHCVNDILVHGARPIGFLDYFATGRLDAEVAADVVSGVARGCRAHGMPLVGGETAEMPDVYREDELDFAATCVGVVERDTLIDGSAIEAGDLVIGIGSAGVHANGFTLVRRILEIEDYEGEDLLAPTKLYLDAARSLRGRALAFAHVTGGGIAGNLARVLPAGRRAEIDWDGWERPPVFGWLGRHVEEEELRRVFNLGIGWCAVVRKAEPGELVIGRIV